MFLIFFHLLSDLIELTSSYVLSLPPSLRVVLFLSFSRSISLPRFSINATWAFFVDHHKTNCTEPDSTWHFEEKLPKKIFYYLLPLVPLIHRCNKLIDIKWFWQTEIARWLSIKHKEESPLHVAKIQLASFNTAFRRAFNLHFEFACLAPILCHYKWRAQFRLRNFFYCSRLLSLFSLGTIFQMQKNV